MNIILVKKKVKTILVLLLINKNIIKVLLKVKMCLIIPKLKKQKLI